MLGSKCSAEFLDHGALTFVKLDKHTSLDIVEVGAFGEHTYNEEMVKVTVVEPCYRLFILLLAVLAVDTGSS
jgi:hypothetical protein